jgi:hypothetical protein
MGPTCQSNKKKSPNLLSYLTMYIVPTIAVLRRAACPLPFPAGELPLSNSYSYPCAAMPTLYSPVIRPSTISPCAPAHVLGGGGGRAIPVTKPSRRPSHPAAQPSQRPHLAHGPYLVSEHGDNISRQFPSCGGGLVGKKNKMVYIF